MTLANYFPNSLAELKTAVYTQAIVYHNHRLGRGCFSKALSLSKNSSNYIWKMLFIISPNYEFLNVVTHNCLIETQLSLKNISGVPVL